MIQRAPLIWDDLSAVARNRLLRRAQSDIATVRPAIEEILAGVRERGEAALRDYTRRFDGVDLGALPLAVSEAEFRAAEEDVPQRLRESLAFAIANVRRAHEHQLPPDEPLGDNLPGVRIGRRWRALDSVGLYVPRGRGAFPSMLYMLAVPARIAGVGRISIVTPPDGEGRVDAACLCAARLLGIDRVYRIGGAQAIAALAYGAAPIEAVDKIVGPGSIYVNAAKQAVAHLVDVGLPAGPSEAIILATEESDPWTTALDLLIEAEHGSDSAALLITTSRRLAEAVLAYLPDLIARAERRRFLEQVFGDNGYGAVILTRDIEQALEVVNRFAPEHLQIRAADPHALLERIEHAGEVLLGEQSAFSLANYAAGANAVLPTGGAARSWSAISVGDFMKSISVVEIQPAGLQRLSPHVIELADYEGFFSHAEALRRRTQRP